jgi:hypothetical protein
MGTKRSSDAESACNSTATTSFNSEIDGNGKGRNKRRKSNGETNSEPIKVNNIRHSENPCKAVKTSTGTIPIHRGRFKQKYLAKHALLLRKADPACGILVSCVQSMETRALGLVRAYFDEVCSSLFPEVKPYYAPLPPANDVDLSHELGSDQVDSGLIVPEERTALFQVYDSGCSGLLFYRFRNNLSPTVFASRFMGRVFLKIYSLIMIDITNFSCSND